MPQLRQEHTLRKHARDALSVLNRQYAPSAPLPQALMRAAFSRTSRAQHLLSI